MPLIATVSPQITRRFQEVAELVAVIKHQEVGPPLRDTNEVRILRGLFYVHLYGAFEFSINQIVLAAVQSFNDAQVPHANVVDPLGALVLDQSFKSIRESSSASQWDRRLHFINLRRSGEVAKINDGVIDLQNIWLKTIESIFKVFAIPKPAMYDVTKSGYVLELVDSRNKVAHGRESPLLIGSSKRSNELLLVYDAIRSQAFYVLDCFNEYVSQDTFKIAS